MFPSDSRRRLRKTSLSGLILLAFLLSVLPAAAAADGPPVQTTALPLAVDAQRCAGAFVAHDLAHTTSVPGNSVEQFEANGAGLALGDLDNDGDIDIVLGNHAGANSILWNQGGLNFRAEAMTHGDTRAVNLIDLDADGWLDILLTRRTGAINYWRNLSGSRFQQETLPGISRPAYAMTWGDLDDDGDLDLITGSYDAGLLADLGSDFLLGSGAGVFVYSNEAGRFRGQRLAATAQAMSIVLFDINDDGQRDIVVGNDFAVPDDAWLHSPAGWIPTQFDATSYSTMSLDAGDIDNDGRPELFGSDMMPYADDPATVAAWRPLMADMDEDQPPGDPQQMHNVLQIPSGVLGYLDAAGPRGLAATGWTWSAKFGDLDQDGWLDLYAVNGMAEATIFAHLPNGELVEANQAMRNIGNGYFRPAPAWRLDSSRGGRGMSMGDLDGDGDLDIVVNNLGRPAQLLENRLCSGRSLQVDLRWPGSGNTRAIGAVVSLTTSETTLTRDVRAASGYLSGDPSRLHFGFPAGVELQTLQIHWPDGALSELTGLTPDSRLVVTR